MHGKGRAVRQHLIALAVMAILGCVTIVAFLLIIDAKSRPASSPAPAKTHAAPMTSRTEN
jgi:hypothetical protein